MEALSGPVGSILHPEHFQIHTASEDSSHILICLNFIGDFIGRTSIFEDETIEKVDKVLLVSRLLFLIELG